jgi:hypothetical protein
VEAQDEHGGGFEGSGSERDCCKKKNAQYRHKIMVAFRGFFPQKSSYKLLNIQDISGILVWTRRIRHVVNRRKRLNVVSSLSISQE